MKNLQTYLSNTVINIKPYQWSDIPDGEVLRFDTNTLPYYPPSVTKFTKEISKNCPINEYADPNYKRLKTLISEYENVEKDMITVTNSGDEAIDILAKTFINPGELFITTPPTYEMFEIQCMINKAKSLEVPLIKNCWDIQVNEIIKQSNNNKVKIIFLVNPNNPTGSIIPRETIIKILSKTSSIVVVDEVYREFYGVSAVQLLMNFDNLIILRSFSKFAAMAGARIGYLIASKYFSEKFDVIRFPMGVSYLSYKLAEIVLEKDKNWINNQVEMIITERKRLADELMKLGFFVYPSRANFLLVNMVDRADEICRLLKEKGIIVRNRNKKRFLSGCVRITVRSPKENTILLRKIREII